MALPFPYFLYNFVLQFRGQLLVAGEFVIPYGSALRGSPQLVWNIYKDLGFNSIADCMCKTCPKRSGWDNLAWLGGAIGGLIAGAVTEKYGKECPCECKDAWFVRRWRVFECTKCKHMPYLEPAKRAKIERMLSKTE